MPPVVSLLFHDVIGREPRESGFSSPAADRYKLTIGRFQAELSALQHVAVCVPPAAVFDGATGVMRPCLITVDDGGVSYYTTIADQLERRGWRGACFVTTDYIGRVGFLEARQIRALCARGHLIGSHSASHPSRFSACSPGVMREEWRRSREVLEDLLGQPVTTASLPGGYLSRAVVESAAESGYRLLFTSEPTVRISESAGCTTAGRFTIRRHSPPGAARTFVASRWARVAAWAAWNGKGVAKPLLGAAYPRVADWLVAGRSLRVPRS